MYVYYRANNTYNNYGHQLCVFFSSSDFTMSSPASEDEAAQMEGESSSYNVNLQMGSHRRVIEVTQVTTENLRKLFKVSCTVAAG